MPIEITKQQYRDAMLALNKARAELEKVHDGIRNVATEARDEVAKALDCLTRAEIHVNEQPWTK